MAFHVAYTEKSWFESSLVPARLVAGVAAQLPPPIGMAWQSVVFFGIPLVGSRGEGAAVWPWGKQQIWIGVGLGHVPSKCRKEKWRLTATMRCVFCAFFGGVSGVSGFWSGGRAGGLWRMCNPYLGNRLNRPCTI